MTSTLYLLTAGMSSFELEEIRVTKRAGDVLSRLFSQREGGGPKTASLVELCRLHAAS